MINAEFHPQDLGNISILKNNQEYDENFSFSTSSFFQPLTTNQIDKHEIYEYFSIGVSVVLRPPPPPPPLPKSRFSSKISKLR